jgi:peptidoglycan/LPS O-acetylase OafA/YrhL
MGDPSDPRLGVLDGRVAPLDGVRGIAVILVLAFHLGLPGTRGGWVGVDVFFGLSGFLITSLLVGEWRATGRVSFSRFWARRARRLLPALLVMLPGVILAALLLDRATPSLRGDAFATLGYVANWRFIASDQSYFTSFDVSPLRHTWSLAIEEQFYLVWPLAIVLLLRFVRRPALRIAAVVALAAWSAWWMRVVALDGTDLSRAYYGSDTRLATILAGCVAALAVAAASDRTRARLRRVSGWLVAVPGVALVAVVVSVSEDRAWLYTSGGFAGIAVLAAVVVVGAAHLGPGRVRRILALPLLVRAGLLSYGLYLWHWPVIVLLERVDLPRPGLVAVQVGVAVTLAELSYRFVEHPIRTRRLRFVHALPVAGATLAAVAVLTAVALPGATDAGTIPQASSGTVEPANVPATSAPEPRREAPPEPTPATLAAVAMRPAPTTRAHATRPPPTTVPPPPADPPLTVPAVPPDILVLGDSLVWVVAGNPPPDSPFAVRGVFHAKCDIVGDRIVVGGRVNEAAPDCRRWPERWDAALAEHRPDAVVVIGGLRQLFDLDVDGRRIAVGSAEWERAYRDAVRRALRLIRERVSAPVLWFDVPCYRWDAEGTDGEEHDRRRIATVNAALREVLAADPGVTLVDYRARVCDGEASIEPLRPDGAHLTVAATHDLWRWLEPIILRRLAEAAG